MVPPAWRSLGGNVPRALHPLYTLVAAMLAAHVAAQLRAGPTARCELFSWGPRVPPLTERARAPMCEPSAKACTK